MMALAMVMATNPIDNRGNGTLDPFIIIYSQMLRQKFVYEIMQLLIYSAIELWYDSRSINVSEDDHPDYYNSIMDNNNTIPP
jgi:hypothetical protein